MMPEHSTVLDRSWLDRRPAGAGGLRGGDLGLQAGRAHLAGAVHWADRHRHLGLAAISPAFCLGPPM